MIEIHVPLTVGGILQVDDKETVYVTIKTEDKVRQCRASSRSNVHRRNSVIDGELTVLVS